MARTYARFKLTIWADQDFRDLSDTAQALYFRLVSSPTMSLCGVADWRPNRLAALTRGMTSEGVVLAAKELEEHGFVLADDATEEILVRTFVRHDGLIATPNIAASMVKDYAGTASARLRGVIVHELARLHDDEPSMKGWAVASALLNEPRIDPSQMPSGNPSGKASGKASGNPSVKAYPNPSGEASGNGSDIPHPSSLNPQPLEVPSKSGGRKRPARPMPDGWKPNDRHAEIATERGIDLDHQATRFRDWAEANDRRYADWDAAFRNWLTSERNGGPGPRRPRGGHPGDQLAW